MYNCHIHTFNKKDIPSKFIPLNLINLLDKKWFINLLKIINPFTDQDKLNRYSNLIDTCTLETQEDIFNECSIYYPKNTKFFVLSMDLNYMGSGKLNRNYEDQLIELKNLKDKYPNLIHPFIHIDPRRKNYYELFIKSIEEWGFKGVKLYPPIGYYPYDERLYSIYDYCSKKEIPIMTHCSPLGSVYFKGKKKLLNEYLNNSKKGYNNYYTKGKRNLLCSNFTHPKNYEPIIKDFPNLKICLSHFGCAYSWDKFIHDPREKNWFTIIKDMISKYDNVYTDISFIMSEIKYFSLLKIILNDKKIKNKILFGSDYYMVKTKSDERVFGIDLRAFLGEEKFKQISVYNPIKFINKN